MNHGEYRVRWMTVTIAIMVVGFSIGCLPDSKTDSEDPLTAGNTATAVGGTVADVPVSTSGGEANGGTTAASVGDSVQQRLDMGIPQVDAAVPDLCPRATARITANHNEGRHVHMIPSDDITLGEDQTYSIQGEADHDHTVMFNGFHFGLLQLGKRAMLTSSEMNGHTHSIEVRCATGN